jgi:hypothetical protein
MRTAQIRQHLHQYIDKAADAQIEAIYTLLEAKVEAVQERISLAQYNEEIAASEQEYEDGNHTTQSEFVREIKQW